MLKPPTWYEAKPNTVGVPTTPPNMMLLPTVDDPMNIVVSGVPLFQFAKASDQVAPAFADQPRMVKSTVLPGPYPPGVPTSRLIRLFIRPGVIGLLVLYPPTTCQTGSANVGVIPVELTVVECARNIAKMNSCVPETGIGTPSAEINVVESLRKLTTPWPEAISGSVRKMMSDKILFMSCCHLLLGFGPRTVYEASTRLGSKRTPTGKPK